MSMNTEIYQDISTRTAGDIYIGVLTLSSSPDSADRGDLGAVPVTLHYVGHELRLPVVGR